jgi:hypothetical protein
MQELQRAYQESRAGQGAQEIPGTNASMIEELTPGGDPTMQDVNWEHQVRSQRASLSTFTRYSRTFEQSSEVEGRRSLGSLVSGAPFKALRPRSCSWGCFFLWKRKFFFFLSELPRKRKFTDLHHNMIKGESASGNRLMAYTAICF